MTFGRRASLYPLPPDAGYKKNNHASARHTDLDRDIRSILRLGATRDWREVMSEALGEEISARAMLRYFAPLMTWLEEQNRDRTITLPETPDL